MVKFDFDKLEKLEDGWDSYDAPKPSKASISKASELVGVLADMNVMPARILASGDGGVAVIFKGVDIRRALIEIHNGGSIFTLLYDMEGFSNTLEWEDFSEKSIKNSVFSIESWLNQ